MEEQRQEITIYDVINTLKKNRRKVNIKLILKAYNYAKDHHTGQKRLSGEEYIIHPLNVANILSGLNLDDETICAAILHDVVEDTDVTKEDLRREFGEEVSVMVDRSYKTWKTPVYNKRRTASGELQKNVLSNGKRYKSNTYKACGQTS